MEPTYHPRCPSLDRDSSAGLNGAYRNHPTERSYHDCKDDHALFGLHETDHPINCPKMNDHLELLVE